LDRFGLEAKIAAQRRKAESNGKNNGHRKEDDCMIEFDDVRRWWRGFTTYFQEYQEHPSPTWYATAMEWTN
jgi:hypothetical protein